MKKIAGVLSLALLLLSQAGIAPAQMSDYETIEAFKKRAVSLQESLTTVQDAAESARLGEEVGRLQAEYAPHRRLLADGLYPQTLESTIAALRDQARRAAERIALAEESQRDKAQLAADAQTIGEISQKNEQYRVEVEQLTLQVTDLNTQIQKITDENTGLIAQIKTLQAENKKDKASIAKLQALNDKLNANVRDRDALVLKMMDGMFQEYSKAGLTDAQRKDLFVSAQGNDYVGTIVATIDGNVKYAEAGLLSPQDVQLVRDQQQKLVTKWEEIKPLVGKLYQDEEARVRDVATVDTRVAEWRKSLDQATWKSIHEVFAGQKVDIGPFASANEFHDRLVSYIDAQAQNPTRAVHQTFKQKVWDSPIKDQWLPVIPTEELTASQRADIEQRIAVWDKNVAAIFRRWVLMALLGAAALVAAGVLFTRKRHPALPA